MYTILDFRNLGRSLGNRNTMVRESASVSAGNILTIKGPSGSGKSTLLRMLARLIAAESGEVYFKGTYWHAIPATDWRRSVHYVSQKPVMFRGSVEDNLRLPFALSSMKEGPSYSKQICEQYMKTLDLPSELLGQNAQTLSGGEASRIALIRALMIDPTVVLLDEPTAYLDDENRIRVMQLVARWVKETPGRAIIIVTHGEDDLKDLKDLTVLEMGYSQGALHNG